LRAGARDGAVIVRYLHQFYTDAGFVPNIKDTAHFSLTIDMESAHLLVHWEEFDDERPAYYMEPIMKAFLDNEQQVADMRHMMKNILAHAFGSRLANLRAAVESIQTQQAATHFMPSRPGSIGYAQADSAINIPPPSPESLGDESSHPPKKRQRTLIRISISHVPRRVQVPQLQQQSLYRPQATQASLIIPPPESPQSALSIWSTFLAMANVWQVRLHWQAFFTNSNSSLLRACPYHTR
jgi:hypothetical protein